MRLRIGLDFDNTIANYDSAFPVVAKQLGLSTTAANKRELKRELFKEVNGEDSWQRVQGLAYGRFISLASLNPGVLEFIIRSKVRDSELFIVSHKTEFGHFDETKTPLRDAATNWLIEKRILGAGALQIPSESVFYTSTRLEKLEKIRDLELDVFIDDLSEVLVDALFPVRTKKVLFRGGGDAESFGDNQVVTMSSWRDLSEHFFGEIEANDVLYAANYVWPSLSPQAVERVDGRGNSKIFKLLTERGPAALKIYPEKTVDRRPRRETEWSALNFLYANKFQVPEPIGTDIDLDWSILEWVSGVSGTYDSASKIHLASDFIRALYDASKPLDPNNNFSLATEACLTPSTVVEQIQDRLFELKKIQGTDLQTFLSKDLEPCLVEKLHRAKLMLGEKFSDCLDRRFWVLSPSDFGLHNSITTESGDVVFFDFEYFGWDDPVKLTADFCHHPGMSLSLEEQKKWIDWSQNIFKDDSEFLHRLRALFPLYAIRWALIILNEFRPDKIKNRLNAESRIASEVIETQLRQLEKAKLMIMNLDRSPI